MSNATFNLQIMIKQLPTMTKSRLIKKSYSDLKCR